MRGSTPGIPSVSLAAGARALIPLLCALMAACPGKPSPPGDPAEIRYDLSGGGSLVMADGTTHPFNLAYAISSNPDFHAPESFQSCLRVYAYFADSPLCAFIQLAWDGEAWLVKGGPASPFFHLGYGPYPDGFVLSLPYHGDGGLISLETSWEEPWILRSLSLSEAALSSYQPALDGWQGEISSLSLSLDFSSPLGWAAADQPSSEDLDAIRFMDSSARRAAVGPELDQGLKDDPVAYAPLLVSTLTEGLSGPLAKARVIHDWIAAEVAYDDYWYDTYYASDPAGDWDEFTAKSPCAVLSRRITVCGGYSQLFWYLCRLAGVDAPLSRGWVKSSSDRSTRRDHSWNIIRSGGILHIVDTTADSLNSYGLDQTLSMEPFKTEWFLPPAELAVFYRGPYEAGHAFPGALTEEDAFYDADIPAASMTAGSNTRAGFWERGLSFTVIPKGLFSTGAGGAAVSLSCAGAWPGFHLDGIELDALPLSATTVWSSLSIDGQAATLQLSPPRSGYYCFRLWAHEGEDYELLASFALKRSE